MEYTSSKMHLIAKSCLLRIYTKFTVLILYFLGMITFSLKCYLTCILSAIKMSQAFHSSNNSFSQPMDTQFYWRPKKLDRTLTDQGFSMFCFLQKHKKKQYFVDTIFSQKVRL